MKKLDWLLIRSFIGPLAVTFSLAVFVLLIQFLWKYIDDLVGKGLDLWIIAQLLFYASAVSVPMALPIATLFASIMTMGNFGERYELVAMKSAGISLKRIIAPLAMLAVVISILAFLSANYALPYANLKRKQLLRDVTHKKPTLNIKPNEYYSDLDNYVIRIKDKGKDGKTMQGILLYNHQNGLGNNNVTYAKKGEMSTTKDGRYLYFDLYDGYNYTEQVEGRNYLTRPLTRLYFKEHYRRFDLSSFEFKESNKDDYKNSSQMLNIEQLKTMEDSLKSGLQKQRASFKKAIFSRLDNYKSYSPDTLPTVYNKQISFYKGFDTLSQYQKKNVVSMALDNLRNSKEEIIFNKQFIKADEENLNRYAIERHKKFTLSIACFLLFLVGAPFGSIVRKGGLGVPLIASVLIFITYYVLSMIGEKAVREGAMNVWVGMWGSTYILLILGIFLTLKSTTDSPLFDIESWEKRWNNLFKKKIQ